ncbi:MAG: glycosyltransferase family 4 protein, partial [Ignavibacteriales bacterium]|nr:glycosyltransferase family 4 protein [Ignavibacteriales bacterium]
LHHLLFKRILDWKFGVLFYGPHSVEMYLKMWNELIAADVIMLHTLPFPHNYIGFWAGRVLRKPVVIIPHFHPGHPDYERRSNYWLMNKCDAVLADTAFERNHLATRGVGQEKIAVVGVGVNPDDYRPGDIQKLRATMEQIWGVRVGDKVITFLGRKMEKKGVSVLIDAIKVLHEHIPVKLILAGPGFEWFSVLYMSLASEVKSFVIDAGVLTHEEKVDLLHATDILVLPSKFESFGIVFLEAWACGVPVIGTTEGAAPEVIGDAGLTVPYGDVAALSSCIRHALADPSKLRRMAEQGRRKIHEYHSWQMIGARVEKVLEGVIA